jgi:A-factor type gamma-butyrolactone 1'-reductase (1S-forming)
MVNATIGRYGALHGAFNNAGVGGGRRPLHDLDTGKFDAVIATNLRGVFLCVKYEIAAMLECGGGSVVVTASVGGLVGAPNNSDYAASKWALSGLVKCAALDYARRGIRVNAIAPGPTESEMFRRWLPDEAARAALAEQMPMNYIADPDDMARVAVFLLSDESRWTTGAIIPCDGGRAAM